VLTEEKLDEIGARLEHTAQKYWAALHKRQACWNHHLAKPQSNEFKPV
jgi:hypothetical protein